MATSRSTISTITENVQVEVDPTDTGEVRIEFPRGVLPIDSSLVLILSPEGARALGDELVRVAHQAAQRD